MCVYYVYILICTHSVQDDVNMPFPPFPFPSLHLSMYRHYVIFRFLDCAGPAAIICDHMFIFKYVHIYIYNYIYKYK